MGQQAVSKPSRTQVVQGFAPDIGLKLERKISGLSQAANMQFRYPLYRHTGFGRICAWQRAEAAAKHFRLGHRQFRNPIEAKVLQSVGELQRRKDAWLDMLQGSMSGFRLQFRNLIQAEVLEGLAPLAKAAAAAKHFRLGSNGPTGSFKTL